MTANALVSDREMCLEAGMNDHIAKPIDPDELFGVLFRWVGCRQDGMRQTVRARSSTMASATSEAPLAIDGIDVKLALKRTGGNRNRYEGLLRRFAHQQATTVEDIRKALSMGDAATAERAAHSLKGAAGTLGVNALPEAAAKAEMAIKTGQGIDNALTLLGVELAAALGAIRAALPDEAATNGSGVSREPYAVVEPLTQLKRLLETDDGEAADFMIDARAQLAGVLTPTELMSIEANIADYDYKAALENLSLISRRLSLTLT